MSLQDLELRLERVATSDTTSHPHNYLAKSEHVRLLEARLATQAAEHEAALARKLNEARREVLVKVRILEDGIAREVVGCTDSIAVMT